VTGRAATQQAVRVAYSALVIGESGVGKTHYAAQLLGRLNHGRGRLVIDGAATNLSPFEEALRQLSRGLPAAHTPSGQFRRTVLPLADRVTGARLDVMWPDYAGEQVSRLVDERNIPEDWRARAESADAWILLVRLQHVVAPEDMLSRPAMIPVVPVETADALAADTALRVSRTKTRPHIESNPATSEGTAGTFRWSDQARLVELLQLLLAARHTGYARVLIRPRLLMLLSCWDELPPPESAANIGRVGQDGRVGRKKKLDEHSDGSQPSNPSEQALALTPANVLAERAPLLSSFVESNWAPSAREVYGLSSTGRALRSDHQDEEYIDRGPEEFGYVITPEGEVTDDLTLPLVALAAEAADSTAASHRPLPAVQRSPAPSAQTGP
jgi:hypothetical protein